MPYPFRYAICNEVFQGSTFHDSCKTIRAAGYDGIEIAPFTLSESPRGITADQRRQYRGIISSEGLRFAGLHWLMVAPKGLHVTTPDDELRNRSWNHIRDLVDLCADLGDNAVMVFGSPQQRSTTAGSSVEDAKRRFEEGLAGVAGHAMERHVTILVEALPKNQCDVILTLAEAAAIVENIGSSAVRTMFDTHNAVDETEPHAALIDRYFPLIKHVHLNETDGRYPGAADYDFKPVLDALARNKYTGWVSMEVFDFSPGAEKIARESLRHVQSESEKVTA